MTREELRENVARAILRVRHFPPWELADPFHWELADPFHQDNSLREADAAIAIVLEEAAKVASRMHRKGQIGPDIAAAIRALIPSEEPPGAS